MNKHTIVIEGLPEGWEPVAFRVPEYLEYYFSRYGFEQATDEWPDRPAAIIIQKTKPREITLVETDINADYGESRFIDLPGVEIKVRANKIWRVKEES